LKGLLSFWGGWMEKNIASLKALWLEMCFTCLPAWDDDSNRGMPCVETGLCVYASDALEASPFSAIAAPYLRKRVDQLPCVVPLT